jgi:hypothetical protein
MSGRQVFGNGQSASDIKLLQPASELADRDDEYEDIFNG